MSYVGIDHSMNCPAICVAKSTNGPFEISYLTNTKKYQTYFKINNMFSICGMPHSEWNHPMQRWHNLAYWTLSRIPPGTLNVYIEDYAMGAKGKVFGIGETSGILKYVLWNNNIPYKTIPPTVIKKFATTKGNANKNQMYEAWINLGNPNLKQLFDMENCVSPLSDVVDSFFICLMACNNF